MQNFKDIILKNLFSAVIFFTYLLAMPSVWMAEGADVPQIFIGNGPGTIEIQQGMSVEIPVFFVGGMYTGKTVELYVFRIEDGEYVCFGPGGWESDYAVGLEDVDPEDFKPVSDDQCLPEYILLRWQAFKDSQSLSNFDLWVCVDDQVDGIPTENSVYCGHQSIIIEEDNNGTGTGDDNGTGTGDDNDTGTGDDTGGGGTQPLIAPPFFDLSGGSGGVCNSLEYTPEGTTFSQSSISKSLELDDPTKEITLITSACGQSVTVSSVYKASGGEWLSVRSGGGSKIILNLNPGVTGLQAGSTYTGAVTVAAGGITDTMSVTLRVLGQCDPTSASVTPTSLTFQACVDGQNPSAQTLRVKDNCGDAVSANASSELIWLTLTRTGTGVFSVSCNDSCPQEIGSYSGTITLSIDQYGERSVSVKLEVTDTPTQSDDGSVPTVDSGHVRNYDIKAFDTKYFQFVAGASDSSIQVHSTSQPNQPHTVHLLIKRGSLPTIADFERTWEMSASQSGIDGLYFNYNTGARAELVEIRNRTETNKFFIMLYNYGENNVQDQRLSVYYHN